MLEEEGAPPPFPRNQLQDRGNRLRQIEGLDYLAREACDRVDNLTSPVDRCVFDGIRNHAEANYLRARFQRFFLVAVQCPYDQRWQRLKAQYEGQDLSEKDFRDQFEDSRYGQQVQRCVDDADVVLDNAEYRSSHAAAVRSLKQKISRYVDLMAGEAGEDVSFPSREEIIMTMAYAQAQGSCCLKRHVGAVIATESGNVIAGGFNENVEPMKPCYQEFQSCRKDSMMVGQLENLTERYCPDCGKKIQEPEPPYRCGSCGISLKTVYFQDRGMRWCTAMHAEVRALRNASGRQLDGAVLYSTTFPCYDCAKEMVQSGIKTLVYVEPYPDQDSVWYFKEYDFQVRPFEGVKARAFHRLYARIQQDMEAEYVI